MSTISLYAGSITQQPASLVPRRLNYPTAGHSATNMSSSSTIFLLLMVSSIVRRPACQQIQVLRRFRTKKGNVLTGFLCVCVYFILAACVHKTSTHTSERNASTQKRLDFATFFCCLAKSSEFGVNQCLFIRWHSNDYPNMYSFWLPKSWWKSR